jgi:beta-lactamase regulating signal transducer with metallopeptidase domain
MIALWMIYVAVLTVLLGGVAAMLERVAASHGWPRRWIWTGALVGIAALSFVAWKRPVARVDASAAATGPVATGASLLSTDLAELLERVRPRTSMLERLDGPLAIAWISAAAFVALVFAGASATLARRRREWRRDVIDGVEVLIAPSTGPALVGLFRPVVVLPEWALSGTPGERDLMLAHEREHARARDPIVLHAGWLGVLAMPWNPAAWWMARRLRAAVELDCDARVLRSRPDPTAYSALLVAVGVRHASPAPALAAALLERRSTLARRIIAMRQQRRVSTAGSLAAFAGAAFGIVLACSAPSPEVLAPLRVADDQPRVDASREIGARTAASSSNDRVSRVIAQYFPMVASGTSDSAVMIIVEDATGKIVGTELTADSDLRPRARARATESEMTVANKMIARRPQPLGSGTEKGGILDIDRSRIEAIEVVKKGSGVITPRAVSLIWIKLKPDTK